MIYEYTFLLLVGIGLVAIGWSITFTKKGLEWMYKNKIWKEKDPILDQTSRRLFDRITASGVFLLGLILVGFSLIQLFTKI